MKIHEKEGSFMSTVCVRDGKNVLKTVFEMARNPELMALPTSCCNGRLKPRGRGRAIRRKSACRPCLWWQGPE